MLTQQTTCTVWTFNQDIVCRIVNGKPTNINIWNSRRLYWWRQICLFYRSTINIFRLKWGWITSKKKPEEKKSINESFWEILIFVLFSYFCQKTFFVKWLQFESRKRFFFSVLCIRNNNSTYLGIDSKKFLINFHSSFFLKKSNNNKSPIVPG